MRTNRRDWPAILTDAQTRGITMAQLAREQEVSYSCVAYWASYYEIKLKRNPSGPPTHRVWPEIFASAIERGVGVSALAREQGVTKANVVQRTRTYGVTLPGQYKESAR